MPITVHINGDKPNVTIAEHIETVNMGGGKENPSDFQNLTGLAIPKTILLLSASPAGETPISSGKEYKAIQAAVRHSAYEVRFEPETSRENFADALRDFKPAVLHFSGHGKPAAVEKMGSLEVETTQGGIVLESNRLADEVPTERLAAVLQHYAATLECVLLNMCYGAASVETIRKALPSAVIIGTSSLLNDALAIEFARRFYGQLAAGQLYQKAFVVAKDEMKLMQGEEVEGLYLLAGA